MTRFAGRLHTWNGERGFGFIRPSDGGDDVFVHVSALPDPVPRADEILTFEVAVHREGRKKAVNVRRQAHEAAALQADRAREGGRQRPGATRMPQRRRSASQRPRSVAGILRSLLLVLLLVSIGYAAYREWTNPGPRLPEFAAKPAGQSLQEPYRCDGRTHCSQMRSCEEATFFLRHCPGVEMDGDGDGVPCERQWCTGSFR